MVKAEKLELPKLGKASAKAPPAEQPGSPSSSDGLSMGPLLPEALPGRPSLPEGFGGAAASGVRAVKTEVVDPVKIDPKKRRRTSVADALRRSIAAQRRRRQQLKEVKQEPGSRRSSKRTWAEQHYTHQVALIRQLIPKPRKWIRFYGNLGTGIIGVRPKYVRNGTSSFQPRASGHVVLFINAPSARLQHWNGRTLAGYTPMLDIEQRKLLWESQRNDLGSRVIERITQYVQEGSEVVVAVREGPGETFRILGRTQNFQLEAPSRFMVDKGDYVVAERGSKRVHRCILPQCLDGGLKSGVGLVSHTYPLPKSFTSPQFCSVCCRTRATASLIFEELDEAAARLLAAPRPGRRLRGKQAPGQAVGVKRERAETPRRVRRRVRWRRSLAAGWTGAGAGDELEAAAPRARRLVITGLEAPPPVPSCVDLETPEAVAAAAPAAAEAAAAPPVKRERDELLAPPPVPSCVDLEAPEAAAAAAPAAAAPAAAEAAAAPPVKREREELLAERNALLARLQSVELQLAHLAAGRAEAAGGA